jgi:asparagine synthase (glutamine-hydrolysing)
MCGINGFYSFTGATLQDPVAAIDAMNAALSHRGPDDEGAWNDPGEGIYLGHRRLSILDLSAAGHQPMRSPGGPVIVFNGEVYNYRSLKANLNVPSYFSETDTEVLLYLYEREGPSFLNQLNGMFALAIWDPAKRELFLARDRIGIKPLYYTTMNGIFAFSSEIKALLTLPWVRAERTRAQP